MILNPQGAQSYIEDLQKNIHRSMPKQLANLLTREKSGVQANLRKHSRHKSLISELTDQQTKRIQQLQAKLDNRLQSTSRKRQDAILKTVKRCKMHSKLVKRRFEKAAKQNKTETNKAANNLKEFNKTMQQYWDTRRKSQMDKEKELYWRYVCKTHEDGGAHENQQQQNQEKDQVSFLDNRHSTSLKQSLTQSHELKDRIYQMPAVRAMVTEAPSSVQKISYSKKYSEVKTRANKIYEEKEQEVFQKYAEKMQIINKIKSKRGKSPSQDSKSSKSSDSDRGGGFMLTQSAEPKPFKPKQRHIVVRSLQKPRSFYSTQMHRAIDHSRQNLQNRKRLQQQMMQQHDYYLEQYTTRLQHVKALKQLREQLHQKKLYYSRR